MKWIGLTGGIATGKSTVSEILKSRNLPVVDADRLAREVVLKGTEGFNEIVRVFGPDALLRNGELDRKAIGAVVFSDRTKLQILENIVHPRVRDLCRAKREALSKEGFAVAFYDVPLLFEKNMRDQFDSVVLVAAKRDLQIERLMKRDALSREEAENRLAAQIPIDEKVKLADYVIVNDGSLEELRKNVDLYVKSLPGPDAAK